MLASRSGFVFTAHEYDEIFDLVKHPDRKVRLAVPELLDWLSRLDPATDRLVHTALGRLLEGRTGIIVAHRLATLAYADDILVLEDGQVREYGPQLALTADPASRFAGLLRVATEEVTL